MKNDIKIDFQLLGTTIPPKEISRLTGIKPDTELMRGERNGKMNLPRQNIWSIQSHVGSDDVAAHWVELEVVLKSAKEKLREIAATGRARITLVISSKQRIPSIMIPASMSEFAGFINAVIDIDHIQY
jgi:hypothetical protein